MEAAWGRKKERARVAVLLIMGIYTGVKVRVREDFLGHKESD